MNRYLQTITLHHFAGLIVAALFVFATENAAAQIKIALSSSADTERSGTYVWATAFAEELERSGLSTRIYPSSTLGNEIVRTEQVRLGLLEINVTGGQEISMFSDLMDAAALPFMLLSDQEIYNLLDKTEFLQQINRNSKPLGVRVIGFAQLGGMGGLFTARTPVHRLEDMSTLRLRAMSTEQLDMFEAWGAAGTQVAWEEVPQALQTGIADGYLNAPIVAVMFGHGPQLDYFTDLRYSPSFRVTVMSERWFQSLEPEKQKIVQRALYKAGQANRRWSEQARKSAYRHLEDAGIELIPLSEQERMRFRERILPLYHTQVTVESLETMLEFTLTIRAME